MTEQWIYDHVETFFDWLARNRVFQWLTDFVAAGVGRDR